RRLPLPASTTGRRYPCSLVTGKQPLAGWPLAAGGASAHRQPSCCCRVCSRPPACGLLPMRVAAPCKGPGRSRSCPRTAAAPAGGRPSCTMAMRVAALCRGPGRSRRPPCRWPGHAWLPLLLIAFAAKTQQERVERFYAIQSHHT
ncbi:hypothetical protein GW17_00056745, partial [Ensete ventricosum]